MKIKEYFLFLFIFYGKWPISKPPTTLSFFYGKFHTFLRLPWESVIYIKKVTNRIRSFDYYSLQHWFTPTHVTKWVNNGHQITNIFISNFIFIHAIRLHISLQPASYLTLNWISSVLPVSRKILYKPWAVLSRIFEDFCRKIQSNIPLKCFINWV